MNREKAKSSAGERTKTIVVGGAEFTLRPLPGAGREWLRSVAIELGVAFHEGRHNLGVYRKALRAVAACARVNPNDLLPFLKREPNFWNALWYAFMDAVEVNGFRRNSNGTFDLSDGIVTDSKTNEDNTDGLPN